MGSASIYPEQKGKICLIRPPTVNNVSHVGKDATPPVALAYLTSSLKGAGFEVQPIDAVGESILQYTRKKVRGDWVLLHGLTQEQVLEKIDPDALFIGVSVMFSSAWLFTKELIDEIKKRHPNKKIILGGEHATACPEYILENCPSIDACVLGEGEHTLIDLADAIVNQTPFDDVAGVVFRNGNKIIRSTTKPRIKDVDAIPRPDWDSFNVKAYIDNGFTHGINMGPTMPILASRGCPYQCTFCSNPQMWTTIWKAREPKDVVQEMKDYVNKYRVTNFDFYDLTAIVQKKWIVEFCTLLEKEKLNITWQLPSGTRSEAIDSEVTELMFRSGCRAVNYAPESGSKSELTRVKKRINLDRMLKSAKDSVNTGMQVKCNFIFGMPGQTLGEVFETFGFITRLAWCGVHSIACFPFAPYPGSEIFSALLKEGSVKLNEDYFKELIINNNPEKTISFNKKISSNLLPKINIIGMIYFFSLSFIFHPSRLLKFLWKIIRLDNTDNKLLTALSHRYRKKNALKLSLEEGKETIIVPPNFQPKEPKARK